MKPVRTLFKRSGKWVRDASNLVASWIGSRPPRVWGSLYILMIPFAGFIFWTLPSGSFYDSNLTRETGFKQDLATAASLLDSSIQEQEHGEVNGNPLPDPTWDLYGTKVTMYPASVNVPVADISVDTSGKIELIVQGWAQSSQPSSSAFVTGNLGDPVTLEAGSPPSMTSQLGSTRLIGYPVTFVTSSAASPFAPSSGASNGDGQIPLNVLLPGIGGGTAPNQDASLIWMSPSTASVIERLSAAGVGDPKEASGLFVRMCYFSATTITTLGFGDITPVSTEARVLAAAEAVLGVVIVGLFLNAVAQKWKKS